MAKRSLRPRRSQPPGDSERARRNELFVVIIMGVTAILTAWAGYQSTKWSGEQSAAFNRAAAARTESVRASTAAEHERSIDVTTFVAWLEAIGDDDTERADFIKDRFTDRLTAAFDEWLESEPCTNPAAPATPFELDAYVLAAAAEADALSQQADEHADWANTAGARIDRYVVMTVAFALVLLFAGTSTKLESARNRTLLLGAAGAGLLVGAVALAMFPVTL